MQNSYLDRASTRRILSLTQWLGDSILKCSSELVGARKQNVLVEDWFMQACKDKDLGAWAAGSRARWMTMETLKLCVRWSACRGSPSSISLACFKQEEQTKLMYFPVQMATVLPLRTAWIEDIHSQAPLRDVQRHCCWNSDSGARDGQRLWNYGATERSFNAVSAMCVARFDAHANRLQDRRQPIAKSGNFVRASSRTALNCKKKTILSFLPSLSTPIGLCLRGGRGRGRDLTWQPAVKHESPAAKATTATVATTQWPK